MCIMIYNNEYVAQGVTSVSVLPDGRIISGSLDHTIRIWDGNTGECMKILKGHTSVSSSITMICV